MLTMWGLFTSVMWLCTFKINMVTSALFFFLAITFFLLAIGVKNEVADMVAGWTSILAASLAFALASIELIKIGGERTSMFCHKPCRAMVYRGQFQRKIGLGHGLVLDNLTLECRGTFTGAVTPPEGAWRQRERGYFALGLHLNRRRSW